jgi:processive 1,2-diacylglycerol beta-glucosyltransferase
MSSRFASTVVATQGNRARAVRFKVETTSRRILILSVSHGASHQRVASALRTALIETQPGLNVKVVDALEHCPVWFRHYYNSYSLFLRFCPALWGFIENLQHGQSSTSPTWIYRLAARGLDKLVRSFDPDIVVATEVGMCEIAALLKREMNGRFSLVGAVTGMDADRAWSQPEVDLYPVAPGETASQLSAAGVPREKILDCGQPVDPLFTSLPNRQMIRTRLGVERDVPLLLLLFGGEGTGKAEYVLEELRKLKQPHQAVFIAGRSSRLKGRLEQLCLDRPAYRVFGWVDNMHEWMAAADLLVSKPGATTMIESLNCALPLLAVDPTPGNEVRACEWIEKSGVGYSVKRRGELANLIETLLLDHEELELLRRRSLAWARPYAAYDAAEAILDL